MSYRLETGKAAGESLRLVAASQAGKAVEELDDARLERAETVHRVRKRCKKLRGLLRLYRGPLESDGIYATQNERIRDAARSLSGMRDGEVLTATLDDVLHTFAKQIEGRAFAEAKRGVTRHGRRLKPKASDVAKLLGRCRKDLASVQEAAKTWDAPDGFEAIGCGLEQTYRRGRRAFEEAYRQETPEAFHEWRKRVKYHGYHVRLLRDLWPEMLGRRRKLLEELGDLLGLDHDMAVLGRTIAASPREFGPIEEVDVLLALIDTRRRMLEAKARPLGRRLFAEKPARFVRRIETLWDIAADEAEAGVPERLVLSP